MNGVLNNFTLLLTTVHSMALTRAINISRDNSARICAFTKHTWHREKKGIKGQISLFLLTGCHTSALIFSRFAILRCTCRRTRLPSQAHPARCSSLLLFPMLPLHLNPLRSSSRSLAPWSGTLWLLCISLVFAEMLL
jgi:hypothetical protein